MATNEIPLDERIEKSLRAAFDTLSKRGELLSSERLKSCYETFLDRFGPARLKALDGEALLEAMHSHGNQDSLVYWLEFKNDEEFPGPNFGSIAGGSAHKFGLFRRKETGQWVSGSPQNETNLTVAKAVELARKHREQLVAGVDLLDKFPAEATDDDYQRLQQQMEAAAPDVSRLAWGHKYFSLLFPAKLDDYHNHAYQRYNLIKLLQLPTAEEGLYTCAGRFVKLAKHLGWPMNHFTAVLNERNGRPIKYWRIGTKLGQTDSIWPFMRDGGYVAVGWAEMGDLSKLSAGEDFKEVIKQKLEPEYYPGDPKTASRKAGEIYNFVNKIEEGDVVLAAEGQHVLGIGRVTGQYRFEDPESNGAPHRRKVDWLSTEEWDLPQNEGKLTTVFRIGKYEENLVEAERHLLDGLKPPPEKAASPVAVFKFIQLEGIPGRIQGILDRKGQVILYGPPGTGKTFWARKAALDLAAASSFGKLFDQLGSSEQEEIRGNSKGAGLVRFCTFHPGYGYEDFIEGYRPTQNKADQLLFGLRQGTFKALCRDAAKAPVRKYFLVIDEINRGDIPRIFGELLTLLELDKRGLEATLPVSGEQFFVPPNVYVIGTMNTADRSIALLDTALRRRFGFLELMPDVSVLAGSSVGGKIPLGPWLTALNERIRTHCGRDARNLQVGHAYLLEKGRAVISFPEFARIVAEDIIPLLEEYCYEDYSALRKILGEGLIDEQNQRIRAELFAPAQQEKLVQALSAISPEMSTSLQAAIESQGAAEAEEPGEQEESDK